MGILCDYFVAADDAAAARLVVAEDGGSPLVPEARVDGAELKGLEPSVTLSQLVEFAGGVKLEVSLVWQGAEDGPWLVRIDDAARDTLAGVTGDKLELATRWGAIEELAWNGDPVPGADLLPAVEAITALAQRAREKRERLYCWMSL